MHLVVADALVLRSMAEADAEELYGLIARNRERLAQFMPWAAGQTLEGTGEFIRRSIHQEAGDDGFQAALIDAGAIAGVAGFHRIDRANSTTTIGYWLGAGYEGRGLMAAAVATLIGHAFARWGMHRIELRIAPDNSRSRALAERLGFREEGHLREAERFGADEYRDLVLYALLSRAGSAGGS